MNCTEFEKLNNDVQTGHLFTEGCRKGEINSDVCMLEYYTLHDFYLEVLVHEDGSYGGLNAFTEKGNMMRSPKTLTGLRMIHK